jgi:hypothetical protein
MVYTLVLGTSDVSREGSSPSLGTMKIIFLDHDGVICLSQQFGGRYKKQAKARTKLSQSVMDFPVEARFDNFDKKAIKVLNLILEETGAEIVVSSDWKNWANVEEMGEYYEQQGIIKKPIDFTPREYTMPEKQEWHPDWDLEASRTLEIQEWLKDHPEVTHWVAIDDLDMSFKEASNNRSGTGWGLKNFVHTPSIMQGIKQSGIKEKVLKFLK